MAADEKDEALLRPATPQDARSLLLARVQAERDLARTRALLAAVMESTADGLLVIDGTGVVTEYNQIFAEMWGLSPELLEARAAQPLLDAMAEQARDPAAFRRKLATVRASGLEDTHDVVHLADDRIIELFSRLDSSDPNCDRRVWSFRDITRRVQAEIALGKGDVTEARPAHELSSRLAALVESSDDAIFSKSLDEKILSWNQGAERMFGYRPEEVIGQPITLLLPKDRVDEEERLMERIRRGERVEHYETLRLRKDGTALNVSLTVSPIRDSQGRTVGISKIARDITERKLAEEARELIGRLPTENPSPVLRLSREGIVSYANPAALQQLAAWGLRKDELAPEQIIRFAKAEEKLDFEATCAERTYQVTVAPILPANYVNVYFTDISRRKRAEDALAESEQRFQLVADAAPVLIWVAGVDQKRTYFNKGWLVFVGRPLEQEAGTGWQENLHPADRAVYLGASSAAFEARREFRTEYRLRRHDGEFRWMLDHGVPRFSGRDFEGFIGSCLDITDLKVAESKRRESEERFRALADNIAQFAWMADPHGWIFWYNRRWFDYTGTTPEEMAGWGWQKVQHPDHLERVVDKFRDHLERGEVWEDTFPLRGRDGSYRWFLTRAVPLRDEEGNVMRWFGTNTDITEQREAERNAKLARDQALAASRAKDDFVAALSHELRTPLNPVLLVASDAAHDAALSADVRAKFEVIRKNAELEARLIDDLLDLTAITRGKLRIDCRLVDVHAVLNDAMEAVQPDVQERELELVAQLQAERHTVCGDAVRLQQIFWNVLKNAVKFTAPGGRIVIRTSAPDEGNQVIVDITDSGIGMTPQELERVFSAFAQGDHAEPGGAHRFGGLGLGLAISQKLAEMHQGRVRASSAGRDQGSTFTVELPLARPGETPPRAGLGQPIRSGQETERRRRLYHHILLVEDHEATRTALAQILLRRGYEVVTADSLASARAVAEGRDFDLLISDIGLPDGSGYDLMSELRQRNGLKGIALTGYGMETDVARSRAAGFVCHLTKPVRVQTLEAALTTAETSE